MSTVFSAKSLANSGMFRSLCALSLSVITGAYVGTANAETIIIQDCQGMMRGTQEIAAGAKVAVAVAVEKAATAQSSFSLSNLATGANRSGVLRGSNITFSDVGAGSWSFCADGVGFSNVRFIGAQSSAGLSNATLWGAGVGGVGAAAAAIAIGSGGGSSGSDQVAASGAESPSVSSGGSVVSGAGKVPSSVDDGNVSDGSVGVERCVKTSRATGCRNTESPKPISPYR